MKRVDIDAAGCRLHRSKAMNVVARRRESAYSTASHRFVARRSATQFYSGHRIHRLNLANFNLLCQRDFASRFKHYA